jgi:hypothetical protein
MVWARHSQTVYDEVVIKFREARDILLLQFLENRVTVMENASRAMAI